MPFVVRGEPCARHSFPYKPSRSGLGVPIRDGVFEDAVI